jgi:hypothetical protein
MFINLMPDAQESNTLRKFRAEFQEIASEEDIDKILNYNFDEVSQREQEIIKAYQAAGTSMMAEYVFSPMSKLRFFNKGKIALEGLIDSIKDVEKVYLRLLIQLNVPKTLNYHKNIEEDISYLQQHMAEAQIEASFKSLMIKNLLSITKKKELKEAILDIKL